MPKPHHFACECPRCLRARGRAEFAAWIVGIGVVIIAAGLLTCFAGCSATVTPAPVIAAAASYDGAWQNSGVLSLDDSGAVITAHARDRYNALIGIYGKNFLPAITADHGVQIAGQDFHLSNEGLTKFAQMNAWRKTGKTPPK